MTQGGAVLCQSFTIPVRRTEEKHSETRHAYEVEQIFGHCVCMYFTKAGK